MDEAAREDDDDGEAAMVTGAGTVTARRQGVKEGSVVIKDKYLMKLARND